MAATGGLNIALIIHIMQVGPDKMKAYIEGLDRNTTYRCVFFSITKKIILINQISLKF